MSSDDGEETPQSATGPWAVYRGWTYRSRLDEAGLSSTEARILRALLCERWFTHGELVELGGDDAAERVLALADERYGAFQVEACWPEVEEHGESIPAGSQTLRYRIRPGSITMRQISTFIAAHTTHQRAQPDPLQEYLVRTHQGPED